MMSSIMFIVKSVAVWPTAVPSLTRSGPRNWRGGELCGRITIGFCGGLTDTRRSGGRTGAVSAGGPQFWPSNGR
jgi:hypothetical protein